MNTPKRFILGAVLALLLAMGFSQPANAQIQITAQFQSHPLNPEASFFYDQLTPYGRWIWIEPQGWVWTPNNVDAAWRPYTDGGWVYSDYGWTWAANEPWGWAPYHYGRWFFHERSGWCWVPGSEWSPAWVTWHWGDDWCGWAPMPPQVAWQTVRDWDAVVPSFGWSFVANRDFHYHNLKDHIALVARNVTLLRATRNVTHFEVRNQVVMNFSITPEQIQRAGGHEVRRYQVAEAADARNALRGKTQINIYRPVVKETKIIVNNNTRVVAAPPARQEVTFDKLRRDEAAHHALDVKQTRDREALEKVHQAELRTPPKGVSAPDLMQRHQEERKAFDDHVQRQHQVFDGRQQGPTSGNDGKNRH